MSRPPERSPFDPLVLGTNRPIRLRAVPRRLLIAMIVLLGAVTIVFVAREFVFANMCSSQGEWMFVPSPGWDPVRNPFCEVDRSMLPS